MTKKKRRTKTHSPVIILQKKDLFKTDELSSNALRIFLLLYSKYNGFNNGQLTLTYSEIKKRNVCGFGSHHTFDLAIKDLKEKEWIEIIKPGGLHKKKALYAINLSKIKIY